MGSLYRSEEMTLCQLFLQSEAAYTCVSELGELGMVQFRDLNPDVNAFQRKFVNEVRRCDEMERKLRFLEKEIKKDSIPMLDTGENPDAPLPREMIDLEATFEKLENEMKEVNANSEALKRNYLELTELKHILRRTQGFFEEAELLRFDDQNTGALSTDASLLDIEQNTPLLNDDNLTVLNTQLGFVAGVILRERLSAFERMLWRACRGNVFLKQADIDTPLEDPVTADQVNKVVFIIFFQGDQLKSRVKKICEGFRATLYPCPETPTERREMAIGVMTRIEDLNTVLGQTQDHRHRVLVAAAKNIKIWFIKVKKIKAIYHTLNMFNLDVTQKCLIAECWCAIDDLDKIQLALRRGTERTGSSVPSILNRMITHEDPPTFHRTNKFTACFQGIVDSYGVATYREVNAAPFAVISFPFLFSLMFGDAGHGLIMLLFGVFMLIKEKKIIAQKSDNEIWNIFFGGRYIIVLMGAFSIYSGLLYNDIFSKSVKIFSSGWHPPPADEIDSQLVFVNPANLTSTYPFGMDPVWQLAKNKITFLNSFKMKLSISFGVLHMLFGVMLSASNHRYFKQSINIFCEFIPQVIFMVGIFGYLVFLVFLKWFLYDAHNSQFAPNLLIGFINMFMMSYCHTSEPGKEGDSACMPIYSGQEAVQKCLLALALICVPWMLLLKPFILWRRNRQSPTSNSYPAPPSERAPIITPPMTDEVEGVTSEDEVIHLDGANNTITVPPPPQQPASNGVAQLSVNSGDINVEQTEPNEELVNRSEMQENRPPQEEFDLGEVFINSAIHTIEYCLGCISHTASYLRLWALSLAHAELSEVLWSMVFAKGLMIEGWGGAAGVFIAFTPWALLTVAVLLLMEGLSAFLHTLRLHWVEFMSKFYKGNGYLFVPFSFEKIINDRTDE